MLPKVNDLIRADQRLTIMEVSEELGIYSESCQAILTKFVHEMCVIKVCSTADDSRAATAPPVCSL